MKLPVARTADLIEQETNKELLIYDLRTNKAYNLNETSKNIFQACNGVTSFEDIQRQYQYTDDLISFALDELHKNDLIEGNYISPFAGISRREVIKKVGLATMIALPVITGLIAPTAAHAQSQTAPCPTNVCIPFNANACAGCSGRRVTFTVYSSRDSSCTGGATSGLNVTCGVGVSLVWGNDSIRTAVS